MSAPAATSSAPVRHARSLVRRDLLARHRTLADVLIDPPDEILDVMLCDLIRWQYKTNNPCGATQVGRWAVRDRINLLITVRNSSSRTREWVAGHAGR